MRMHNCAGIEQGLNNRNGRRIAHIICIGFEREAKQTNFQAPHITAQRGDDLAAHSALSKVIGLHDSLDYTNRRFIILSGLEKRQRVLGKATAAIARTSV